MAEIKVGDVVQLNSGGPKMTVLKVDDDKAVECIFWAGEKSKLDPSPYSYLSVPAEALMPADDEF